MKYRWWVLGGVSGVGFFIDWLTKSLASRNLMTGVPVPVLGNYLEYLLIYNKNALFGLNPRNILPWFPLNGFFTVFTIIAIIALVIYYRNLRKEETAVHWGIAFILPGALGNLYDRIAHAHLGVVDFIKVDLNFWPVNPWPIFNMADVYVTVGVGLIIVSFIAEEFRRKNQMQQTPSTALSRDSVVEPGNQNE